MKKIFPMTVIVLTLCAVGAVALWCSNFGWHRPYINWSPGDLAEYLVKNNRSASECYDLLWFEIMAPSQAETQAECVYRYAKLTKDPSSCDLLMPSSYGLSCVGVASESPICGINHGFEVQWHEGDEIQRSSLKNCQKPNGRTAKGDQCCVIATVSGIRGFNDCSSLANDQPLLDNCLNELAFKNHDPSSCESIQDPNIKAGCIVSAKGLKQDPSICSGCTQPVESVDQLE